MTLSVSSLGTTNSTSSSSSIAQTGVTAAVGDWLVVIVGADNSGTNGDLAMTTTSISDSASNTWTNRGGILLRDPGAASAGSSLGCWTAPVTNALSSGTVTCSFSPNVTSKGIIVLKVVPTSGYTVAFRSVGVGSTGTGSTFSVTESVTLGDTIFGFMAAEVASYNNSGNGDLDSLNGSWSSPPTQALAFTGSNGTSMNTEVQWKSPNATGNQTYNGIYGVSVDWCVNNLILGEDSSIPPEILGDLSVTDETDAVTSASIIVMGAAADITDAADIVSADGSSSIAAAFSLTDEADTVNSAGALDIVGAASMTDADDTLSSQGGALVIQGIFDLVDDSDGVVSASVLALQAALSLTDESDILSSVSILPVIGNFDVTDSSDALVAFGGSSNFGDLIAVDETDLVISEGVLPIIAALSLTDGADVLFATNSVARGRNSGFIM